jgi:hypothetical protein
MEQNETSPINTNRSVVNNEDEFIGVSDKESILNGAITPTITRISVGTAQGLAKFGVHPKILRRLGTIIRGSSLQ